MANESVIVSGAPEKSNLKASSAITPGSLVEFGGTNDVQDHTTAAGNASPWFAQENPYAESDEGERAIDTDYTAGETVSVLRCRQGDVVRARVSGGASHAAGTFFESGGDGTLVPFGTGADNGNHENIVAKAMETIDATGGTVLGQVEVQ